MKRQVVSAWHNILHVNLAILSFSMAFQHATLKIWECGLGTRLHVTYSWL